MKYPVLVIARYSFLEAVRSRVFLAVLPGVIILFGLSQFIGELSVTESTEIQGAVTAYLVRIVSVFIICLFVVTSTLREFNEKAVDIIFALPIPRYVYYLGKLSGFIMLAIVISILFSLPLFLYADTISVLLWMLSLVCELMIMTSLCLLFLLTLANATVALCFVFAFYVLARTISTIQLIAISPVIEATTLSQQFITGIIDVIAYLLPDFARFTQTGWLVYGTISPENMFYVIFQALVYVLLLSAAAMFDLYRKEL